MLEESDLPGFYRDPESGQYFAIPSNPCTYVPDLYNKASNIKQDEISFNKRPLYPNKCRINLREKKTNGILDTFMHYQNGTIGKCNFELQATKLKLRCFKEVKSLNIVDIRHFPDAELYCKYITYDGSTTFGVWSIFGEMFIFKITKTYSKKIKNSYICGLDNIKSHFVYKTSKQVNHMTPAQIAGGDYVFICTLNYLPPHSYNLIGIPATHGIIRSNCMFIQGKRMFHTCAFSSNTRLLAVGASDGICLYYFSNNSLTCVTSDTVLARLRDKKYKAVEFMNSGNVVLGAFSGGMLNAIDVRTNKILNITNVGRGVENMKILNDDWSLITSGYDNKLLNVDTRMNKIVFEYSDHVNEHRKIPFTCNESTNILCSPGQDNATRFWNLKLGEPLASLKPPLPTTDQIYSVFSYKKYILSTSVFVDNSLIHYEPVYT